MALAVVAAVTEAAAVAMEPRHVGSVAEIGGLILMAATKLATRAGGLGVRFAAMVPAAAERFVP